MVDVVLQNAWVLYHINKDEGDESLSLLACNFFDRTMSEFRMSHQMPVMRWHIIRCHLKNKACVRCTRITSDAAVRCKANLHDIFFEIFHGY